MPSSVIPIILQLESSAMVVGAAGGNLCITKMGAESTVMSHNEAFEHQSPMHDARLAHRCEGEGAQGKVAAKTTRV
jgi:hypothetical protein